MAKRKRLSPAPGTPFTEAGGASATSTRPALSAGLGTLGSVRPDVPIARVAGDAASSAALADLARTLQEAREGGRLIQALPLDQIDRSYLHRDRVVVEEEELSALAESLRAHGQRAPIDVVSLEGGRFGLISGWRRLTALERLHEETGEARFASVLAVLRAPADAADAYVAMIEENELRVGLSYYERAQVAARAAEAGAFEGPREALRGLFATASRPRRSKIGAFLVIHDTLGPHLRFPAAIPERLGLRLSRLLSDRPIAAERIAEALAAAPRPDAAAELSLLEAEVARFARETSPAPVPSPKSKPTVDPPMKVELSRGRIVISGPGADEALRARIERWLTRKAR